MAKRSKSGVQLIITQPSSNGSNAQVTPVTPTTPNFHANLYARAVAKKKMGRPRSLPDVTTVRDEIREYFEDAEMNKAHPNKAGLALWLCVVKSTLQDYADGKYDDPVNDYSAAIKEGYGQIEAHWTQLLGRPTPSVGAIFYMKAALGYRDVPMDNPGGNTNITFILPPEIADKFSLVPKEPDAPTPVPPEDVKIMNDVVSPETSDGSVGQTPIPSS